MKQIYTLMGKASVFSVDLTESVKECLYKSEAEKVQKLMYGSVKGYCNDRDIRL